VNLTQKIKYQKRSLCLKKNISLLYNPAPNSLDAEKKDARCIEAVKIKIPLLPADCVHTGGCKNMPQDGAQSSATWLIIIWQWRRLSKLNTQCRTRKKAKGCSGKKNTVRNLLKGTAIKQ
jgi:hypothetical protein